MRPACVTVVCAFLFALLTPAESLRRFSRGGQDFPSECAYDESVGFQVGDIVRIYKPSSRLHNQVHVVGCPGKTKGTANRVCFSDGGSCYSPENLRRMTDLDLGLVSIQNRAEQFAKTCMQHLWDSPLGPYWPEVEEKLVFFAAITRDKAEALGQNIVAFAEKACHPEVQAQLKKVFAQMQASIVWMASTGAERWADVREAAKANWPALEETAHSVAETTASLLVALGKKLEELAKTTAEREDVRELFSRAAVLFDEWTTMILGESKVPRSQQMLAAIVPLSDSIQKIYRETVMHPLLKEDLRSVQAGIGWLSSAAAGWFAEWQPAIANFTAEVVAPRVAKLGSQALEAMDLCDPEKRLELRVALAEVDSRVKQIATALVEQAPSMVDGLIGLASSMVDRLAVMMPGFIEELRNAELDPDIKEILEDGFELIQRKVGELKELVMEKSPEMMNTARELAEHIKSEVGKLLSKTNDGDKFELDDKEALADM